MLHDLQRMIEDELADEVGVESAGLGLAVMTRQSRRQRFRTVDVDAPAAPRPQQELDEALDVSHVGRRLRMGLGQDLCLEVKDRAVGLLESDPHGNRTPRAVNETAKCPHGENGRPEAGIEHWYHTRCDQRQLVNGAHG